MGSNRAKTYLAHHELFGPMVRQLLTQGPGGFATVTMPKGKAFAMRANFYVWRKLFNEYTTANASWLPSDELKLADAAIRTSIKTDEHPTDSEMRNLTFTYQTSAQLLSQFTFGAAQAINNLGPANEISPLATKKVQETLTKQQREENARIQNEGVRKLFPELTPDDIQPPPKAVAKPGDSHD